MLPTVLINLNKLRNKLINLIKCNSTLYLTFRTGSKERIVTFHINTENIISFLKQIKWPMCIYFLPKYLQKYFQIVIANALLLQLLFVHIGFYKYTTGFWPTFQYRVIQPFKTGWFQTLLFSHFILVRKQILKQ